MENWTGQALSPVRRRRELVEEYEVQGWVFFRGYGYPRRQTRIVLS